MEYGEADEEFADHARCHREIKALVKEYARDKERVRITKRLTGD